MAIINPEKIITCPEFASGVQTIIPECDPESNTFKSLTQNTNADVPGPVLELYPNPAKDNITAKYKLPGSAGNAILVLQDVTGRKIKTFSLPVNENTVTLSLPGIQPAIYTFSLYVDDVFFAVYKISITK